MACLARNPLKSTYSEVGSGEPIESENLVEFRLIYQGELLGASRENTRAQHKHELRRAFQPQLRRLWSVNNNLRDYARTKAFQNHRDPTPTTIEQIFDFGIAAISKEWERGKYKFVPLITPELALRCRLDILLLRPNEGKFIFTQGDIDAQLKTLFDALRIPDSLSTVDAPEIPIADEDPFYCLLQDDRLISEVQVVADQLLLLPGHREAKANDCFAVIHVSLNHKNARTFDNWFG
jgi:hypothetical protein